MNAFGFLWLILALSLQLFALFYQFFFLALGFLGSSACWASRGSFGSLVSQSTSFLLLCIQLLGSIWVIALIEWFSSLSFIFTLVTPSLDYMACLGLFWDLPLILRISSLVWVLLFLFWVEGNCFVSALASPFSKLVFWFIFHII